jgi:RNA polymerase sigma-70 factor (ECF subfamily)
LDEALAEGAIHVEPTESLTPESVFDRQWARALISQVLGRLKQEYLEHGNARLFAALEPALTGEIVPGAIERWAADLKQSPGAIKVALHRLRRRFGAVLRSEIAQTVATPQEIDDEIRHLFTAIAIGQP